MKSTILSLVLLFASSLVYAQTKHFKVFSEKEKIGSLLLNHSTTSVSKEIKVESKIEIKMIVTIEVSYSLESVYKNGELFYSSVLTFVNGHQHSEFITEKDGNHYLITKNSTERKEYIEIKFSESLLYLKEPINRTKVYSEFDGVFKPIKSLGNHVYQLTNPLNGNKSKYYYKDGELIKIDIPDSIVPFVVFLI